MEGEGVKLKGLKKEKSKIDATMLHTNSALALMTGGLTTLVGFLIEFNLFGGHVPLLVFLGTMFMITAVVKGIGTLRILKGSTISITKVVVEAIVGIIFILWSKVDVAAGLPILMVYFSASIFANIMLTTELYPLKGWAISGLIALIKIGLILLFITEGFEFGIGRGLASTSGLYLVLDGLLFLYLGVMANLNEYFKGELEEEKPEE